MFKVLLNDLFQDNLGFVEAAKTCDSAGYHLAYEIDQEAARSGDNIKCRLLSTGHLFLSPRKETIIVPYTLYKGRLPTKDDILKYMCKELIHCKKKPSHLTEKSTLALLHTLCDINKLL